MRRRTLSVITAALAATLIGAPAYAYFATSSATVGITIQAAEEFPSEDPEEDDDPTDEDQKVWICKLVSVPGGQAKLAEENNPRQVSASATENGVFRDAHGSPVVDNGEVDCTDVWPPSTVDAQDGVQELGGISGVSGGLEVTQEDADEDEDDTTEDEDDTTEDE